ncbi:MAG: hypothetical protein PVI26_07505 [Chitinispirillia bacterium]
MIAGNERILYFGGIVIAVDVVIPDFTFSWYAVTYLISTTKLQ